MLIAIQECGYYRGATCLVTGINTHDADKKTPPFPMALQSRHDCCIAVLQMRLLLHEADLLHLRVFRGGQHLGHHFILRIWICIDA